MKTSTCIAQSIYRTQLRILVNFPAASSVVSLICYASLIVQSTVKQVASFSQSLGSNMSSLPVSRLLQNGEKSATDLEVLVTFTSEQRLQNKLL